jgi:hypothetical protein
MAAPLFRDGGYQLNFASREVYLDSSGTCVEVRDLTTGQRFHPRNIVVQSFLERFAAAGIKPGLGGESKIQPTSFNPVHPNAPFGRGPSSIAVLPPSSDAARYLNPFGRQLTPEELERLEKTGYSAPLDEARQSRGASRNTNRYWGVRGACDDFAFNDAEKCRGINRFAFTRIDGGFRGKPIENLEELLRTAKPGTIIHMSRTGFFGENANGLKPDGTGQGSHWAVYVGGGEIQDQYGTYPIAQFVAKYNLPIKRNIEALFTHPRM